METQVFGGRRKSRNSLITLYMYAIMSCNTILSCISNSGSPFSPTKGKASVERPSPPFIKAFKKAPHFKECHLRESCKHWSQLCVFARPPELILSNFSAPLVPVIKEAWAFKWAGSLVALSSYYTGLQSDLQCEEGTGANHWALLGLKLYTTISLLLSQSVSFLTNLPISQIRKQTKQVRREVVSSLAINTSVKSAQLLCCTHAFTFLPALN